MDIEIEGRGHHRASRRRRWVGAVAATVVAVVVLPVTFTVALSSSGAAAPDRGGAPQTRVYDIVADHVLWNYAPDGTNDSTGAPFDDTANVFVASGPDRIGST